MTTNSTKYNVKRVTEKDGKKLFTAVATAVIYEDGKAGIIKSQTWGDLKLFRKTETEGETTKPKTGKHGEALYEVKKFKPTKEEGKTIGNEVGTFILRNGNENGVLFLHLLDESFAVFLRDAKEKDSTDTQGEAAAA